MSDLDPFDDNENGTALAAPVTSSSLALQSREVAEIQVKYMMAQRFPRDEKKCLDRIVNAFSRPRLAELAQYEYAKGGTNITGGSIHAAQAIAQLWGNIEFGHRELSRGVGSDGVPYSEVQAYAHDLESRTHRPVTFIVRHWRDKKNGAGYRLRDERDIYELTANMAQRRTRGCIFAVIPQDVIDTALEQADITLRTKADTSPEALSKMLDAFAPFGVDKGHIEAFTQRRLEAMTPAQMVRLKRIYQSLRDEISSPGDWFDMGTPEAPDVVDKVQAARDAIKGKRNPPPPPPPPADISAADFAVGIKNAADRETAAAILDSSRGLVSPEEADELAGLFHIQWDEE